MHDALGAGVVQVEGEEARAKAQKRDAAVVGAGRVLEGRVPTHPLAQRNTSRQCCSPNWPAGDLKWLVLFAAQMQAAILDICMCHKILLPHVTPLARCTSGPTAGSSSSWWLRATPASTACRGAGSTAVRLTLLQ